MTTLLKETAAAISRLEPEIRDAFLATIDQITSAAQMKRLVAAIEDQKRMARDVIRAAMERGEHPNSTALDLVGRMNNAHG